MNNVVVKDGMKVRAKITVSGIVQKAAYRLRVKVYAFNAGLTGTVRNLENGSVEIICEGEKEKIEGFYKSIKIIKYPVRVEATEVAYSEPTGEFKDFVVEREDRSNGDLREKLEFGLIYMEDMNAEMISKQDQMIAKQDATNDSIKDMDRHMGDRFDKLDRISDDMKVLRELLTVFAEHLM